MLKIFAATIQNFMPLNMPYLIVDANFEPGGTPIDELNALLRLDGGDCRIYVLWNDITTVEQAACHVLAAAWITLDHLAGWLEASIGDL